MKFSIGTHFYGIIYEELEFENYDEALKFTRKVFKELILARASLYLKLIDTENRINITNLTLDLYLFAKPTVMYKYLSFHHYFNLEKKPTNTTEITNFINNFDKKFQKLIKTS